MPRCRYDIIDFRNVEQLGRRPAGLFPIGYVLSSDAITDIAVAIQQLFMLDQRRQVAGFPPVVAYPHRQGTVHRQGHPAESDPEIPQALGKIDAQRQEIRNVHDIEPNRRHAGRQIEEQREFIRVTLERLGGIATLHLIQAKFAGLPPVHVGRLDKMSILRQTRARSGVAEAIKVDGRIVQDQICVKTLTAPDLVKDAGTCQKNVHQIPRGDDRKTCAKAPPRP